MAYVISEQTISADRAANLAHFLLINTGSIFGTWRGSMSAGDQRRLMGRFLGKGRLVIAGLTETVQMHVKVCFGADNDMRANERWASL